MRSAFALRIFSGKFILNFAFVALCGALQTHFHGRGRGGKRHLQRRFLRKRGAAGKFFASLQRAEPSQSRLTACQLPRKGELYQSKPADDKSSPFGGAGERSEPERVAVSLGKVALPQAMTEGVALRESVLALSVFASQIHLSQRERPWQKDEFCVDCQGLPLWGSWQIRRI